ncbi:MAG TPA: cation:proton antiporter [Candidatus Hydrogenedentes bacterium]|nr:cation:proton antiporter [Candidatus Hydrogenedentota bacterium]HPC18517.1 cation:proton antiporter [Candidatus Hydrogenedentota bacterium]HRT22241.1 cation:proton antiporter [Candidatus Hydrogenedentota bacterium]HRT67004.1 cation:proton antiporter [Candidatus Hydrogenedentota bacterium]
MESAFAVAALWMGLAVAATSLSNHLRISVALIEICIGIAAGFVADRYFGAGSLGGDLPWLRFLAGTGAVLLTFLAGAELEPAVLRKKWKEVSIVGLIGFVAPFVGCAAVAHFVLGWDVRASGLAGVALSTTSMAVVYAVMLETGFNQTDFGKGILGACFINDLGTVLALGILFAPFTYKTFVFIGACVAVMATLPFVTSRLISLYAFRTAAIRTKWVLFVLFGLGALALWSGSEAVLPAYLVGMILAGVAAEDQHWVRRLRTLTVGLLTPFYFIRAGSLVSLPAVLGAPLVFVILLAGKVVSKIFGLYPVIGCFHGETKARWYYTLMMSTGLTFGTISALYGYSHGIVTREQYSFLVAVVIGSAVVPTMIANYAFLPRHLLPGETVADEELEELEKISWDDNGEESSSGPAEE